MLHIYTTYINYKYISFFHFIFYAIWVIEFPSKECDKKNTFVFSLINLHKRQKYHIIVLKKKETYQSQTHAIDKKAQSK